MRRSVKRIQKLRKVYYFVAVILAIVGSFFRLLGERQSFQPGAYITLAFFSALVVCGLYWIYVYGGTYMVFRRFYMDNIEFEQSLLPAVMIRDIASFVAVVIFSFVLQDYARPIAVLVRLVAFNIGLHRGMRHLDVRDSVIIKYLMFYVGFQLLLEIVIALTEMMFFGLV